LSAGAAGTEHRQIRDSRPRRAIRRILTPELPSCSAWGEFAGQPGGPRYLDHLVRIDLALEGVREDAEVAISTYLSAINNRLSEVMKVLAVVSALLLPGTVITGIFGTNFDNVPGLHSNWGFLLMVVSMVGIAVGMALFFRRRGWF
jgi:magnesium transporter